MANRLPQVEIPLYMRQVLRKKLWIVRFDTMLSKKQYRNICWDLFRTEIIWNFNKTILKKTVSDLDCAWKTTPSI